MIAVEYIFLVCGLVFLCVEFCSNILRSVGEPVTLKRRSYNLVFALLLFTLLIIFRGRRIGAIPLTTWSEMLIFLVWSISVCHIILKVSQTAPFICAIYSGAAFLVGVAAIPTFSSTTTVIPSFFKNPLFATHVLPAFVGYAAFLMGFVNSVIYLAQESALKRKNPNMLVRMPSLEALEKVNYRTISMGFSLFTISLLAGLMMALFGDIWEGAIWSDPKVISAIVTWVVYAVLFYGRLTGKLHGRRVAILSMSGFLLVIFTFMGTRAIGSGGHIF